MEIAEPVSETTAPVTEDSEELPPETTVGEMVAETYVATEPTAAETAPETVSETVPEETIAEEAVQESAGVKNEIYLQELLKGENKWPELYEDVVPGNGFAFTNTVNQLRAYATITVPAGDFLDRPDCQSRKSPAGSQLYFSIRQSVSEIPQLLCFYHIIA